MQHKMHCSFGTLSWEEQVLGFSFYSQNCSSSFLPETYSISTATQSTVQLYHGSPHGEWSTVTHVNELLLV